MWRARRAVCWRLPGVAARERVQQRRGLGHDVGVGVLAEYARPWPVHGGAHHPEIPHTDRPSDGATGDPEGLFRWSRSESLAEAAKQLGEPLRAALGQAVGQLVVLGAQELVVERCECELLHAAAFTLEARPERLSLLLAQPQSHRPAQDAAHQHVTGGRTR